MTGARLTIAVLLAVAACAPVQTGHLSPSPTATHTFAGGCGGTELTDGDAVAFVFANELVAGSSPRVHGTNNKVLWVAKGDNANFIVEGIPPGGTLSVVTVNGGPSIVDVPSPGCWTFRLSWGSSRATSTINLDVLPAGRTPPAPAA